MTTTTATRTGQITAALAAAQGHQLRAFVLAVRTAPLRPWMEDLAAARAATSPQARAAAEYAAVTALIVAEDQAAHAVLGVGHATAALTDHDAAVYGPGDHTAVREADVAVKAVAAAALAVDTGALTADQVPTILGTLTALTGADNA